LRTSFGAQLDAAPDDDEQEEIKEELSQYERVRLRNIARNKELLAELGLDKTTTELRAQLGRK